MLGIPLPGVEAGIAASAILLGTALMTERRFPLYAAAALVGFFAIFHGHAHGTELPPGESGLLYSLGFVVATGCLHAIGIAIGAIHRWPAGRVALRVAGGGVGVAGDLLPLAGHRMKPLRVGAAGRTVATALALASCAPQAHAHLIETGLGPVYDGIAHFALTPEDLIPALALAVLAGLRGRDHARRVIFVLPLAWLLACFLGISAKVSLPDSLSWVPLLVLGGLVAADFRLPIAATTALAAALGLFLGLSNGYVMAQAGPGVRGGIGIVGAVFVVTTLGAACAVAWQSGWLRIAWRVAGSWIAASGLLLLGWSLR